jgi:hypothetical protein
MTTNTSIVKGRLSLVVLHLINALWIGQIFAIAYRAVGSRPSPNYLADPILMSLVGISVCLHIIRWRAYAREDWQFDCQSSIELRTAMRNAAKEMYGRFPYLIGPIPNDRLLGKRAELAIAQGTSFKTQTVGDVVRLVTETDHFRLVHAAVVVFGPLFLYAGGMPSSAGAWKQFWVADALLVCAATNLFIYSAATLILVVCSINRDS